MENILNSASTEMLREYYYEFKGCYPPEDFTREQLINILLKSFNK